MKRWEEGSSKWAKSCVVSFASHAAVGGMAETVVVVVVVVMMGLWRK